MKAFFTWLLALPPLAALVLTLFYGPQVSILVGSAGGFVLLAWIRYQVEQANVKPLRVAVPPSATTPMLRPVAEVRPDPSVRQESLFTR